MVIKTATNMHNKQQLLSLGMDVLTSRIAFLRVHNYEQIYILKFNYKCIYTFLARF